MLCSTDPELNTECLQQTARKLGFPELAVPRLVVYPHDLPLLGSGKVNYPKLRGLVDL